jgi:hypothetical protein
MLPFRDDAEQLIRQLKATVGAERLEILKFEHCPSFGVFDDTTLEHDYAPPRFGVPILAVTDFGLVRGSPSDQALHAAAWHGFARRLAAHRAQFTVLTPYTVERLGHATLMRRLRLVVWDRTTGVRSIPTPVLVKNPGE